MRVNREIALGVHRCLLEQGYRPRVVGLPRLAIDKNARQDNVTGTAARFDGFLRQRFGFGIVETHGISNFDLRQQGAGIGIAAVSGFLRPEFGFTQVARAKPGIGQIVLRTRISGLRGLLILAARLFRVDRQRG